MDGRDDPLQVWLWDKTAMFFWFWVIEGREKGRVVHEEVAMGIQSMLIIFQSRTSQEAHEVVDFQDARIYPPI